MAVYRFQVTFPTDSAIPRDYCTNTFHFSTVGLIPIISDFDNVRDMLADFYMTNPPGHSAHIAQYMSNQLNGPAAIKAYALEDPIPRAPVYEDTFTFTPSSSSALPSEVALCLSFQAERVSGEPQARRRNRVYLGPFSDFGTNQERPPSTLTGTVVRAAKELLNASNASVNWEWVVWSPTTGTDSEVVGGWVDDAWDTQRRRGVSPSSRTLWNVLIP